MVPTVLGAPVSCPKTEPKCGEKQTEDPRAPERSPGMGSSSQSLPFQPCGLAFSRERMQRRERSRDEDRFAGGLWVKQKLLFCPRGRSSETDEE